MSESIIVNELFSVAGALCAAWLVWGALLSLGELLRETMAFPADVLRRIARFLRRLRLPDAWWTVQ